jgi:hypothetical protein
LFKHLFRVSSRQLPVSSKEREVVNGLEKWCKGLKGGLFPNRFVTVLCGVIVPLQEKQAVVELPMAVGAEGDQVVDPAYDGYGRIFGEGVDGADVTDFDMFVIAAVVADPGTARMFVDITGKFTSHSIDLIFGGSLKITNFSF